MINAIKADLIELISKLQGLPESRRQEIVQALANPETSIVKKELAFFLLRVFQTGIIDAGHDSKICEKFFNQYIAENNKSLSFTGNQSSPTNEKKKTTPKSTKPKKNV